MSDSSVSVPIPSNKRFRDLTGMNFGHLAIESYAGCRSTRGGTPRASWNCICICGTRINVLSENLLNGNSKSCSCMRRKRMSVLKTKHGNARSKTAEATREYRIWTGMKNRCMRSKHPKFHNYGGRGITVCERWATSFGSFLEDMGPCPDKMTLDRIDNDSGYCKTNCRWATRKQQARNMRCNVIHELNGEFKTISEWAEISGINRATLDDRLHRLSLPESLFVSIEMHERSLRRVSRQC